MNISKSYFDCGTCKRIFEANFDHRDGVKYVICPHCSSVQRYNLTKTFNSINNTDSLAEMDGLY